MRRGLAFAALLAVSLALAPPALAEDSVWRTLALGRIIVDAPGDWIAARVDDGSFVVDEPVARRWTLRVDSDQVEAPASGGAARVDAIAERLRTRLVAERGGATEVSDIDVAEKLVVHDYARAGDAARLDVRDWHRIALTDGAIVIARFSHAVAAALAADPGIVAARDRVERAIMGAELNPLAPPYRPVGPALVGNGPPPP